MTGALLLACCQPSIFVASCPHLSTHPATPKAHPFLYSLFFIASTNIASIIEKLQTLFIASFFIASIKTYDHIFIASIFIASKRMIVFSSFKKQKEYIDFEFSPISKYAKVYMTKMGVLVHLHLDRICVENAIFGKHEMWQDCLGAHFGHFKVFCI